MYHGCSTPADTENVNRLLFKPTVMCTPAEECFTSRVMKSGCLAMSALSSYAKVNGGNLRARLTYTRIRCNLDILCAQHAVGHKLA